MHYVRVCLEYIYCNSVLGNWGRVLPRYCRVRTDIIRWNINLRWIIFGLHTHYSYDETPAIGTFSRNCLPIQLGMTSLHLARWILARPPSLCSLFTSCKPDIHAEKMQNKNPFLSRVTRVWPPTLSTKDFLDLCEKVHHIMLPIISTPFIIIITTSTY